MAEIKDDAKLKAQMSMNQSTHEVEVLFVIKGAETEHGWFFTRSDLINLLAHGKVTIPHAAKASPIDMSAVANPEIIIKQ